MSSYTPNKAADVSQPVETTVVPVVVAISAGHLLNDLMQSLLPASYPLLQSNLGLSFTQIGLITLVFQGTASILQPLVGFYTDRRPMPWALASGMALSGSGLVLLAMAQSLAMVLLAVALTGLGSAIFHPESSRVARLAAGMRPGFAQSLFQVGGNIGTAIGPLAAATIVMVRGQSSIALFAVVALIGMILLLLVGRWSKQVGTGRMQARKRRLSASQPLPRATVQRGMTLLIILMFSKFVYSAVFSSYYTFYLIERFTLSAREAQVSLFIFLAAVAAGTIIGGPIGDKIGRRKVILWSIFGILPLSLALPWLPLIPTVIVAAVAGMVLASAFPAMVVYAQDLMPQNTGMVAGLLFGLAFGLGAIGAAVLGILADHYGIVAVYRICAFLPALGLVAWFLPNPRITH